MASFVTGRRFNASARHMDRSGAKAMLDLMALAGQAVGIAGDFLGGVAQNAAASTVSELVTRRLRRTQEGAQIADGLEENPRDRALHEEATRVLSESAQGDAEFEEALRSAVQAFQQGSSISGSPHHQVNVGGNLSGKRHQIAAGNIDNRKQVVRIGIGSLAAVVLALGGFGVAKMTTADDSTNRGSSSASSGEVTRPAGLLSPSSVKEVLPDEGDVPAEWRKVAKEDLVDDYHGRELVFGTRTYETPELGGRLLFVVHSFRQDEKAKDSLAANEQSAIHSHKDGYDPLLRGKFPAMREGFILRSCGEECRTEYHVRIDHALVTVFHADTAETVDPGVLEPYVRMFIERVRQAQQGETPSAEFRYGVE